MNQYITNYTFNTEWSHNWSEGPFKHQDEWDKSWIIPVEFKMDDGNIKKSIIRYDSKYNTFDFDEENYDVCMYFDVYSIDEFRFASEHPYIEVEECQ